MTQQYGPRDGLIREDGFRWTRRIRKEGSDSKATSHSLPDITYSFDDTLTRDEKSRGF